MINQFFHGFNCNLPKSNKDIPPPRDLNEAIPDQVIIPAVDDEKQILKLNIISKAAGPDDILYYVLNDIVGHLGGPVCAIFKINVPEGHLLSV